MSLSVPYVWDNGLTYPSGGNRLVNSLSVPIKRVQPSAGDEQKMSDNAGDTKGGGRAKRPAHHGYVSDAREAHASLGDTVTTVSVIPTGPGAAGVISPNFFLFVTTIGVIVS